MRNCQISLLCSLQNLVFKNTLVKKKKKLVKNGEKNPGNTPRKKARVGLVWNSFQSHRDACEHGLPWDLRGQWQAKWALLLSERWQMHRGKRPELQTRKTAGIIQRNTTEEKYEHANDGSRGQDSVLSLGWPSYTKPSLPPVLKQNRAQVVFKPLWPQVLVGQGSTKGTRTREHRRWASWGVTTPKPWIHWALTRHACPPWECSGQLV